MCLRFLALTTELGDTGHRGEVLLKELFLPQSDPRDGERVVIARQEIIELVQALEELDPRIVRAFRMHRIEHLTMTEIAKKK